jgi:outer membrane protein assembly factor BamA
LQDGGIRGFVDSREVGGRRAIGRIAEQVYVGAPFSFGDFGFSVFSDVGKLWAGDVPYGVETPVRASAGVSLLLAVPMRSTRMWRLEFAAPIQREPGMSRWELRLSHSDLTSFFWREPADISGARARAVPASIYNWP